MTRHRSANGSPSAYFEQTMAALADSGSDACTSWPFAAIKGYGVIGKAYVHLLVCEQVHGPRPAGLEACHSCGHGDLGCFNPKHLYWGTRSDNARDRVQHRGPIGRKLTAADVAAIRQRYLPGSLTQAQLAQEYGVTQAMISRITRGASW